MFSTRRLQSSRVLAVPTTDPTLRVIEPRHLLTTVARRPNRTYSSRICAEERRRKESGGRSYDGENARRSGKGKSYTNSNRRKGRPAWQRSPDDTPLRDGNRDRLMGLLTDRYVMKCMLYAYIYTHIHT